MPEILQIIISIIVAFPPLVYLLARAISSTFCKSDTAKTIGLIIGAFDGLIMGTIMLPLFVTSNYLHLLQAIPIIIAFILSAGIALYLFLSNDKHKKAKMKLFRNFISFLGYGFYVIVFFAGLIHNIIFFMS